MPKKIKLDTTILETLTEVESGIDKGVTAKGLFSEKDL